MQEICIVRECSAEARHSIRAHKPGLTFEACTYHASGVYVTVSDLYGGRVSISTSFRLTKASEAVPSIGSRGVATRIGELTTRG